MSKQQSKYRPLTKHGKLLVLERLRDSETGAVDVKCLCDCGNVITRRVGTLRTKNPSCPECRVKETQAKYLHLVGKKINYLKVIKFLGTIKQYPRYLVRCKCGKEFTVRRTCLMNMKSCGCRRYDNFAKGADTTGAKLTEKKVVALRIMYETGYYKINELAQMYNVSKSAASAVVNYNSWKHVK